MARLIAPSILSADFGNLQRDIEMINSSEADWFHVDVMDGVFVPNISFGMPVLKTVSKHATKTVDVHLMIVEPDKYIEDFKNCGADYLTVHYEACTHLHRSIQAIKQAGMKAGVALNPHTPVSAIENVVDDLDLLLIMSVNPGFGGQAFIPKTFDKIRQACELRQTAGASFLIQVDGGVNANNAPDLEKAGCDVMVAGNAVFSAEDPKEAIRLIKGLS